MPKPSFPASSLLTLGPERGVLHLFSSVLQVDTQGSTTELKERLVERFEQMGGVARPFWNHTPAQAIDAWVLAVEQNRGAFRYGAMSLATLWAEHLRPQSPTAPLLSILLIASNLNDSSKEIAQQEVSLLLDAANSLPSGTRAQIAVWSPDSQRSIVELFEHFTTPQRRTFWKACERNAVCVGSTFLADSTHARSLYLSVHQGRTNKAISQRRYKVFLEWMQAWGQQAPTEAHTYVLNAIEQAFPHVQLHKFVASSPLPPPPSPSQAKTAFWRIIFTESMRCVL